MTNEPPHGRYTISWPETPPEHHPARTTDGVLITDGLPVFTNNLDIGVIDLGDAQWEWYPSEDRYHLWFSVVVHTGHDGKPRSNRYQQSEDRVTTRFNGEQATAAAG